MTASIPDGLDPADVRRVLAAGRALTLPQGWSATVVAPWRLRRARRVPAKGFSHLEAWRIRPR